MRKLFFLLFICLIPSAYAIGGISPTKIELAVGEDESFFLVNPTKENLEYHIEYDERSLKIYDTEGFISPESVKKLKIKSKMQGKTSIFTTFKSKMNTVLVAEVESINAVSTPAPKKDEIEYLEKIGMPIATISFLVFCSLFCFYALRSKR